MNPIKLRTLASALGVIAISGSALAQDANTAPPPPPNDPAAAPPPAHGAQASGQAQAGGQGAVGMGLPGAEVVAADPPPPVYPTEAPAAGASDHDAVVGRLAVGYLGRSELQIGASAEGGTALSAPVIGVRYWLDPGMGLDLGLGFGLEGGSSKVNDTEVDSPSFWGLILHGGVPLALATGRHYVFEIIPEANVGFGSGSGEDIDHSGFQLDVGARAGAEIHFGFMGLPELSLQGSVGAYFLLQSRSTTQNSGDPSETETTQSSYAFRTSVYNSPWSIFSSNIAAFYYF